ncbi:hypothetical protein CAEBREN_17784 [Caenorhabditis brenneri]|uniref:Uncharacterized protein n=1 Tax=Caenorhabditis brenneri TaxID=135651 RepID=G0MMP3_CAEBE|nr:hypothetical protein CAEBREN_17784 [Caenorhabditis brenneri]
MAEPNQNVPGAPAEAARTLSAPKAAFNRTQQYISEFVQKLEAELDYAQEHINDLKQQLFEQSKPENMSSEEFMEKYQSNITERNNKIAELQALIRGLRMELEQKKDDEIRLLYKIEKLESEKIDLVQKVFRTEKEISKAGANKLPRDVAHEKTSAKFVAKSSHGRESSEVRRQLYKQTKNRGKVVDDFNIQESNNNVGKKSPAKHSNQVAGPSVQSQIFNEEEVSYEIQRLKFNVSSHGNKKFVEKRD